MALTQVSSDGVKNDAISHNKIPANAIQASELADNAVDTAAIAADAVTGAKIADDAINSEHYTDGSIDTAHIADAQVTTAKIAADAVTGAKIADNAIDSEHYTDGSIDNAHLADDAVGIAELSATGTASSSTFLRGDNSWTTVNTDLVADTSPQLGGNLDTNGFEIALDSDKAITFDGKGNIEYKSSQFQITNSTGDLIIDNNATAGRAKIFTDVEFEVFVGNTEAAIKSVRSASGGQTELYHSGTKKLETTANGIKVNNRVEFINQAIVDNASNGNDIGVYFSSGGILPATGSGSLTNASKDLGSSSYKFRNVYATTLYGDGSNLTGIDAFPSGTVMLFQQTNAPTGWTKLTSHNNKALRLVSGTPGTGGSNTFSTAFNSSRSTSGGSVSNHTLSTSQMPSHSHSVQQKSIGAGCGSNIPQTGAFGTFGCNNNSTSLSTNSTGGGSSHNHGFTNPSLNLNVQYVDVIMASKD